uniref:Uncharacterized protein n=1 Tax=Brassica oleracea var. oleracea TaxID=109376 RepID=A0A0D2ZQG7_BRAOL
MKKMFNGLMIVPTQILMRNSMKKILNQNHQILTKMTPTPLIGPEKNLTQKKVMRVIHGRKRLKLKTV